MPPESSQKQFDRWRQRLEAGKRVWMKKGMLGNGDSTMRMLIEFYRSNQWQNLMNWGGLQAEELRVVNKIFPTANTMQAQLASRNPRTQYFARSDEWERSAPLVKALHDYDIREQKHKRQLNAAFRYRQFSPLGLIRHGFTPQDEFETLEQERKRSRRIQRYRPAAPDRPWIRAVAPWNCIMDSEQESFHVDDGLRWVAFRDVMLKRDIRDNPNMSIDRDKLNGSAGNIPAEWRNLRDPDLRGDVNSPDENDMYEVWTVYEIEERTWFQMTLSGLDTWLRKPDDWPIPWETLPINQFSVNQQLDTPFEIPLMEDLIPLQIEFNQVRTMIHQGVLRGRSLNVAAGGAFEDDEIDRMRVGDMGEWFVTKGANAKDAVSTLKTTGVSQEALIHANTIMEDFRESGGGSKMSRAQRINVETATEAANVQAGDDVNSARIADAFHDFATEVEALYMQGRRYIAGELDQDVFVRILGDDATRLKKWERVTVDDMHGEYEFELEAGSTQRRTPGADAQQAAVDLQIALSLPQGMANLPFFLKRYLEARGIDPGEGIDPKAQQMAGIQNEAAAQQALIGEPQAGVGDIDANIARLLTQGVNGGSA